MGLNVRQRIDVAREKIQEYQAKARINRWKKEAEHDKEVKDKIRELQFKTAQLNQEQKLKNLRIKVEKKRSKLYSSGSSSSGLTGSSIFGDSMFPQQSKGSDMFGGGSIFGDSMFGETRQKKSRKHKKKKHKKRS